VHIAASITAMSAHSEPGKLVNAKGPHGSLLVSDIFIVTARTLLGSLLKGLLGSTLAPERVEETVL
jgi:hypothetical protein